MKLSTKLGLGSLSGILGAAGIIIGPMVGFSDLARPWSFILGFTFGLLTGLGAALAISGLLDRRKERSEG
ncbi:MAG: hypothetical protein JXB23_02085 [Candidatus Aminicenantes bacterium]|nr:hypothetical protein [Candidatus Aminicenantes bacterium]